MPLLSIEQIADLLTLAHMHRNCGDCGHHTAMDYCRTCDEFYWVHAPGCVMHETIHHGHRLTLVPFVEEKGRAWDQCIVCPKCGWVSHNPHDVEHRYCAHCRAFHDDLMRAR
ncbi:MAG: hypothetical protein HRJ53_27880 [Acidobacteria bacterium Pan2503]|uniref:Uncharacterized protein n=1 Tax=Candidatus Acidiferrum panamense TaxID=2741543 RepID=A0A7V8NWM1_9BACT|nr:hypothetical protein [Candidatus Acidoferrum panamensis]